MERASLMFVKALSVGAGKTVDVAQTQFLPSIYKNEQSLVIQGSYRSLRRITVAAP